MLGTPMEMCPQACCGARMLLEPFCHWSTALQAYETLAILEGTSSLAQQALLAGGLTGGAKLKQQDTHNLSVYFNKVCRDLCAQGRTVPAAHSTVKSGGKLPVTKDWTCGASAAALWPVCWLLRGRHRQAPFQSYLCHRASMSPTLQVKDTMGKFEERLWSLIRNFVQLGHSNPAMLVNAVRIVELQEMVDKQLEASGRGGSEAVACCAVLWMSSSRHCRVSPAQHTMAQGKGPLLWAVVRS